MVGFTSIDAKKKEKNIRQTWSLLYHRYLFRCPGLLPAAAGLYAGGDHTICPGVVIRVVNVSPRALIEPGRFPPSRAPQHLWQVLLHPARRRAFETGAPSDETHDRVGVVHRKERALLK